MGGFLGGGSGGQSEAEVQAAIAAAIDDLLDGAPGALDTLNELAAAVNDDASFSASVTTALAGKAATTTTVTPYTVAASGAAYTSVQSAIDAAATQYGVDSKEKLVYIHAGTYAEDIEFKRGVNITGPGDRRHVWLTGNHTLDIGTSGSGDASRIYVANCILSASTGDVLAVEGSNAQRVTFRNVDIYGGGSGSGGRPIYYTNTSSSTRLYFVEMPHIWTGGSNTSKAIEIGSSAAGALVFDGGDIGTADNDDIAIALAGSALIWTTTGNGLEVTGTISIANTSQLLATYLKVTTGGEPAITTTSSGITLLGGVQLIAGVGVPGTGAVGVAGAGVVYWTPSGFTTLGFTAQFAGTINGGSGAEATAISSYHETASGAHTAANISFSATGSISATNVQSALAELDSEKLSSADLTSDVSGVLPIANGGTGESDLGNIDVSAFNDDGTYAAASHDHDNFSQDTDGFVPGPTASDISSNYVLQADGTWVANSGGITDHGGLSGLGDDDHTIYALADGTRWTTTNTANRVAISDGSGNLVVADITTTELGYLDGVTSNIQSQLDGKAASSHDHDNFSQDTDGFVPGPTASDISSNYVLQADGTWVANSGGISDHGGLSGLGDDDHTIYALADGTRWTTANTANRAVVSDGSGNLVVADITTTELGYLDGVTSNIQSQLDGKAASSHDHDNFSVDTDGYVPGPNAAAISGDYVLQADGTWVAQSGGVSDHGALSGLSDDDHSQYALADGTRWTATPTASRAIVSDGDGYLVVADVTATELGYLDGVTSNIQTQLNGKAATSHVHAASDVTSGTFADARISESSVTQHQAALAIAGSQIDLSTSDRAVITNGSGVPVVSAVTATELGYLDGVTSNIQTQLDAKAATSHDHNNFSQDTDGFVPGPTSSDISNNYVLRADGDWVAQSGGGGGGGLYDAELLYMDVKAYNADGGTISSGGWRTLDLSNEIYDTGDNGTLASNQITLAAGTYRVRALKIFWNTGRSIIRIQDVDSPATLVSRCVPSRPWQSDGSVNTAFIDDTFTIATSKTIEFQAYTESGAGGNAKALGVAGNVSGQSNVYGYVWLGKLA